MYKGVPWVAVAGGDEWPMGPPSNSLKAVETIIDVEGPEKHKLVPREEYPDDGQIEVYMLHDRQEEDSPPIPFWTVVFSEWSDMEGEDWKQGYAPEL